MILEFNINENTFQNTGENILDAWKKCKRSKLGKIFDEQYSLDETNKNAYMYIFNKKTLI